MYLCRSFDQLSHDQTYTDANPVIHIGFPDYTLFEDSPEFYATYKLINVVVTVRNIIWICATTKE